MKMGIVNTAEGLRTYTDDCLCDFILFFIFCTAPFRSYRPSARDLSRFECATVSPLKIPKPGLLTDLVIREKPFVGSDVRRWRDLVTVSESQLATGSRNFEYGDLEHIYMTTDIIMIRDCTDYEFFIDNLTTRAQIPIQLSTRPVSGCK